MDWYEYDWAVPGWAIARWIRLHWLFSDRFELYITSVDCVKLLLSTLDGIVLYKTGLDYFNILYIAVGLTIYHLLCMQWV